MKYGILFEPNKSRYACCFMVIHGHPVLAEDWAFPTISEEAFMKAAPKNLRATLLYMGATDEQIDEGYPEPMGIGEKWL